MDNKHQQRCKACGQPDKFDFSVPDAIWTVVVPEQLRHHVVCLSCFDDFAHASRTDYAASLTTVYFAGNCASFAFRVESGIGVRDTDGASSTLSVAKE